MSHGRVARLQFLPGIYISNLKRIIMPQDEYPGSKPLSAISGAYDMPYLLILFFLFLRTPQQELPVLQADFS